MELMNVKGSFDYLPEEQIVRNYIKDTLSKVFIKYGYVSIETPIINYYEMLALKYNEDDEILNEVYKLTDQGQRRLGLRYDLTVPFAKFIAINKGITMPFKRFEIGNVFRDGPVKVGRNREFIQCDVDVVGLDGRMIEAELTQLYLDGFKALDIDIYIKYNNRKIMQGLILESGVNEEKITDVITILDKIEKLSKEELQEGFINIGLSLKQIDFLLKSFKLNFKDIKNKFLGKNEVLDEGIKEIDEYNYLVQDYSDKLIFTPSLARGQSYYTGIVFEVYETSGKITSSIGGGGRYDNMITNFINDGNLYPAVGISFGLDVIYTLIKDQERFKNSNNADVYIIPLDTEKESLDLARRLREAGYNVLIEMNKRKVGKCLTYASKNMIKYVIIYGEDEVKRGCFNVKNMDLGNSIEVNIDMTDLKSVLR